MKILFVMPAADFSVSDVARGYHNAFIRAGHDVWPYEMGKRLMYHGGKMPPKSAASLANVSQMASETVVVEALKYEVDFVFIVSGLIFHPLALQLLYKAKIPTVILQTESPYLDDEQAVWCSANPAALVCTHEKISALKYGWEYLPHAYDVDIHKPTGQPQNIDVLFIGTGWQERIDMLEKVDWTGINLRLMGLWPLLKADSPLMPYFVEGCVDNSLSAQYYSQSKINLNIHRYHPDALSMNPRSYELAACGAFCLTDFRREVDDVFHGSQPWFEDAASLQYLIRKYLADDEARQSAASRSRSYVKDHSFDDRAVELLTAIQSAVVTA